jgi:hypothetical protein
LCYVIHQKKYVIKNKFIMLCAQVHLVG